MERSDEEVAILSSIRFNRLRGCDGQTAYDGTKGSTVFYQSTDLARYASPGSFTEFDALDEGNLFP